MPAPGQTARKISWGWIFLSSGLVVWAFVLGILVGQGVFSPQAYLARAADWFSPPRPAEAPAPAKDKLTKPELSFYRELLDKPGQPAKSAPEKKVAASSARYTVQVASYREKSQAYRLAQKLAADGHPAYVVQANLKEAGSRWRVRVGNFQDKSPADALARRIRLQARLAAYVIRNQ